MADKRVTIDCASSRPEQLPALISGREREVLDCAASRHVKHGHKDTPELRTQLRRCSSASPDGSPSLACAPPRSFCVGVSVQEAELADRDRVLARRSPGDSAAPTRARGGVVDAPGGRSDGSCADLHILGHSGLRRTPPQLQHRHRQAPCRDSWAPRHAGARLERGAAFRDRLLMAALTSGSRRGSSGRRLDGSMRAPPELGSRLGSRPAAWSARPGSRANLFGASRRSCGGALCSRADLAPRSRRVSGDDGSGEKAGAAARPSGA